MKKEGTRWLWLPMALMVLIGLNGGFNGFALAGDLEPSAPPGPTMRTLDEIYGKLEVIDNKLGPALSLVPKTGQTTCYDLYGNIIGCSGTGQDGEYQKGVAWPSPRFTDNGDGTVTDNLTGLIWLKDAHCFEGRRWDYALSDANGLASGSCGLTDGSSAGDWRLPNIKELLSLVDYGNSGPALPSGHPFTNTGNGYWSSNKHRYPDYAWIVWGWDGETTYEDTFYGGAVWPVRGGN